MQYKVTSRGIEKAEDNERGENVFATWKEAKTYRHHLLGLDVPAQPLTPEQEREKWFAIHGVPGRKSLKNLDAKLDAIKRAEKIENGSEEL